MGLPSRARRGNTARSASGLARTRLTPQLLRRRPSHHLVPVQLCLPPRRATGNSNSLRLPEPRLRETISIPAFAEDQAPPLGVGIQKELGVFYPVACQK